MPLHWICLWQPHNGSQPRAIVIYHLGSEDPVSVHQEKKAASMHACRSPSKMLKEDDYMPIISSESHAIHGEKPPFWSAIDCRGWAWFIREGKSCCRAGRGGGARWWLSATSMLLWSRGHAGRRPVPAVGCVNLRWPWVPPRRLGGSWGLLGSGTPSIFPSSYHSQRWSGQGLGEKEPQPCCKVSSAYPLLPFSPVCTSFLQ